MASRPESSSGPESGGPESGGPGKSAKDKDIAGAEKLGERRALEEFLCKAMGPKSYVKTLVGPSNKVDFSKTKGQELIELCRNLGLKGQQNRKMEEIIAFLKSGEASKQSKAGQMEKLDTKVFEFAAEHRKSITRKTLLVNHAFSLEEEALKNVLKCLLAPTLLALARAIDKDALTQERNAQDKDHLSKTQLITLLARVIPSIDCETRKRKSGNAEESTSPKRVKSDPDGHATGETVTGIGGSGDPSSTTHVVEPADGRVDAHSTVTQSTEEAEDRRADDSATKTSGGYWDSFKGLFGV